MLTEDLVEFYQANGYVVVPGLFSQDEVASLLDHYMTLRKSPQPRDDTVDRRIKIFLQCAAANLELSGRAIVVCENEIAANRLKTAIDGTGCTLESIAVEPNARPIFELKRTASSPSGEGN